MFNGRSERNIVILMLCFIILAMSVGFAVLSTALDISGTAVVKTNSWDVHFENLGTAITKGAPTVIEAPALDTNSTTLMYEITLNQPGDSYTFTVDVVNDGTINAKLNSITLAGVSVAQDVYVNYTVTGINQNDILASGATKTITVMIEYDASISASDLPTIDQTLNLIAALNFVQA